MIYKSHITYFHPWNTKGERFLFFFFSPFVRLQWVNIKKNVSNFILFQVFWSFFGAFYSFHHYCMGNMENSDQDIFQKLLLMCFMEKRKSYRFKTKWGLLNDYFWLDCFVLKLNWSYFSVKTTSVLAHSLSVSC